MPQKSTQKFTIKIQTAADEWMKRTKPVRNCIQRMYKQYANAFYQGGEGAGRRPMPLNIIDRGVQIIAPFLVTNNPRVTVNPRFGMSKPGLKSFAVTLELALAYLFDEIRLSSKTLRPVVIDSLFSMGITKTGVWAEDEVQLGDYLAAVGQPYCDRVNFNDYIGDYTARCREEMSIEGNRYRLPLTVVQESGLFKYADKLTAAPKLEKDTDLKAMVDSNAEDTGDLREMVELQDIWLPDEGTIITLAMTGICDKILRTVEWDGPEGGPYDVLAYKSFPESIIPIPPVYTWLDISKTLNIMVRKMAQNCEREKSVGIYQKGDETDAEVWKNAEHGQLIGLANPEIAKEITIGGFEPKSMEFLQYLEHQFAISYSNLYGIGGRGAQAETLGQEQMLQYNATRALDDMVDQFHNFTRSIVRKLAHFLWSDPMKQYPMIRQVEGIDVEVMYSENAKEGDFLDYTFDIDPYSMSRMSPELRFQKMMTLITGVILPLAPLAAQQGSYPDVDEIVHEAGRYLNIPNLSDWWKSDVPQMAAPGAQQGTPAANKSPGQLNDSMGAEFSSRMANLNQYETSPRAGQSSPPNTPKKK